MEEGRGGLADDGEARDAAERRPLSPTAAAGCLSPPRLTAAMLAGLAALAAIAPLIFIRLDLVRRRGVRIRLLRNDEIIAIAKDAKLAVIIATVAVIDPSIVYSGGGHDWLETTLKNEQTLETWIRSIDLECVTNV